MSQLDELVALVQSDHGHRQALQAAESREELLAVFMDIAKIEGLYVEEAVIEAAIMAAESPQDGV